MESITKNRKHQVDIEQLVNRVFPEQRVMQVIELNDGYFNAAYNIILSDGKEVILKIAPIQNAPIMSYEKNIMYSEVKAMEIVRKQTRLPIAKIYTYDSSYTLCDAPYFIMEKISGKSLTEEKENLTEEETSRIWQQIGNITRQINSITGIIFGYLGQTDMQGIYWFDVFKEMIKLAVSDARKKQIDLRADVNKLFLKLEKDKLCFQEVETPRLVHWDLWDGNIFIEHGNVSGIIDFERSVWGDPLMEVGFRSYAQQKSFLMGYGKTEFTPNEKKRIFWYDIYLFLLVALEYEYRKYETDDTYQWATKMLMKYINDGTKL